MRILRAWLAVAAACAGVVTGGVSAARGQEPTRRMVAPESVAQGLVLVVQDKSGLSSAASPLYLASNRNGWNPGDPAMRLSARSDGRWQIVLPHAEGPALEFKFTRGGWETVEVASDLSDIPNRKLALIDAAAGAGGPVQIEMTIEKFADQRPGSMSKKSADPYPEIHAMGTVKRLQVAGGGAPGMVRDVLVWLPPGYAERENRDRRYPVLYLQDGQNVFEQPPGAPGEWQADETATELIKAGKIEPLIIAAIPNAGADRIAEYLPLPAMQHEARGDAYVEFVLNEVVPRVEHAFRTKPGPENRAIGGSSLGGLISLYASTRHPEVFGKVLAESPSLFLGQRGEFVGLFESVPRWPAWVYVGMGGRELPRNGHDEKENRKYTEAAAALDGVVGAAGVAPDHHKLVIDPLAEHNEAAWAKRLPGALEFLFPPERAEK